MSTNLDIIHAYRHLLRAGLRAVQYSKPARYVLRDQLREGFRDGTKGIGGVSAATGGTRTATTIDKDKIWNTVRFLEAAGRERGLEHRILKNLLRVAGERRRGRLSWHGVLAKRAGTARGREPDTIKPTAYRHYEMTVAMLNHSMGLCLR